MSQLQPFIWAAPFPYQRHRSARLIVFPPFRGRVEAGVQVQTHRGEWEVSREYRPERYLVSSVIGFAANGMGLGYLTAAHVQSLAVTLDRIEAAQ